MNEAEKLSLIRGCNQKLHALTVKIQSVITRERARKISGDDATKELRKLHAEREKVRKKMESLRR